jgi:hypothetical protein
LKNKQAMLEKKAHEVRKKVTALFSRPFLGARTFKNDYFT